MVGLPLPLRVDPDMAPDDGVVRIRLHSYETRRAAACAIRVVKRRRTYPLPGLNIGQKHGVVVALHDDLVIEPGAGHERRPWRVLLNGWLIEAEMPDSIARLNLVD